MFSSRVFFQGFAVLAIMTLFCSQARASDSYYRHGSCRRVQHTGKVKRLGHSDTNDADDSDSIDSGKRLSSRSLAERHAAAQRRLEAERAAKEAEQRRLSATDKQRHSSVAAAKRSARSSENCVSKAKAEKHRRAKELENEIWEDWPKR